jgi:hypothetical protein
MLVLRTPAVSQDDGWLARSDKNKSQQPHWPTPLATTTPLLVQQFRFDFGWQELGDGRDVANIGSSKGLELIPFDRTEVFVGVPPYLIHNFSGTTDGFGDFSWLFKYRLASASEKEGNYVATVFFGGTVPTATDGNGAPHATLSPTLGYGKGLGNFDVQGTFGVTIPVSESETLGTPIAWNNAFQYRLRNIFWPELEFNTTFFPNGPSTGRKQLLITPGLVVGKFAVTKRVGMTVGAGVQIAATAFHTSEHNLIVTSRFAF